MLEILKNETVIKCIVCNYKLEKITRNQVSRIYCILCKCNISLKY